MVDTELIEHRRRIGRDIRRTAKHGQRQAAFGLFFVIALVAFSRHAAVVQTTGVAGTHDAVFQRQMFNL